MRKGGEVENRGTSGHTWTLLTQRVVIAVIREPETPGGFKANMPWRAISSSDTGEDMVGDVEVYWQRAAGANERTMVPIYPSYPIRKPLSVRHQTQIIPEC